MNKHEIVRIYTHSLLTSSLIVETIGEVYFFDLKNVTIMDILVYLKRKDIDISDIDVFKLVEQRCTLL